MVNYYIHRVLKERAKQLYKGAKVQSMWYAEGYTIYICTDHPGFWIGRAGTDHQKLCDDISEICRKYGLPYFKIAYKECQR